VAGLRAARYSGAVVDKVQILYARIQFVCSRKRTIVLDGFVIQPRGFGGRWAFARAIAGAKVGEGRKRRTV
jgi:hypothetical protein